MPFDHLLKSHYFNFFCRLFEESMERSVLAIIFIITHYYYTLYSPSTYVSAKSSLQYFREPVRLHVHCMTYQSVWLQNNVYVAVNFLSQVIFIFLCFNFISIHYHDQKRKKAKITWDKKLTATYIKTILLDLVFVLSESVIIKVSISVLNFGLRPWLITGRGGGWHRTRWAYKQNIMCMLMDVYKQVGRGLYLGGPFNR